MSIITRIVLLAGLLGLSLPTFSIADEAQINHVPYIATYYIQPRVDVQAAVTIDYYVTDFEQREYLLDDDSQMFTIDYWVNGRRTTLTNVPAGDNSITFGPLAEGKVLFSLQVTDSQGRKSHRLYHEFLVDDPASRVIPEDRILHPDLAQFGIRNDDTHPVETTQGLTDLIKWASDNGYRKIVLPHGRYRLDENNTVQMASHVTLDMNGSTFKLNPNALPKALMLDFINCYDAHLINGTFEGDLHEHDYENAPNNSEWVSAISISQGSSYCSVRDVRVIDVTGYGTNTTHAHTFNRSQRLRGFAPGDIDEAGQPIASSVRTTSEGLTPINDFMESHGFIQVGVYLGYQGNPARHWVYRAHFYDENEQFLETIEGYLYRRLYPPANARFVRITLMSTATPENLNVYNFMQPYNCAFVNVHHENIRCVGMALSGFVNLLVEGNTFKNCGWKLARCAFDAEDGWDLMQDLTFRNNVFTDNPNNEFLTCAGHNFVMENNVMKVYIWDRTNSHVIRNNTISSAHVRYGTRARSGYPRFHGNTVSSGASLGTATDNPDREFCIRDNVIQGNVSVSASRQGATNAHFYNCQITDGRINGKVVGSVIRNIDNAGGRFDLHNCTITDSALRTSGQTVSTITGSTLSNSTLRTSGSTLILENNTLTDCELTTVADWSPHHQYILRNNAIETGREHLINVANSYNRIELVGNTIRSTSSGFSAIVLNNPTRADLVDQTVVLRDNTFHGAGGYVLRVNRLPHADAVLRIEVSGNKFNNITPHSSNLNDAANVQVIR